MAGCPACYGIDRFFYKRHKKRDKGQPRNKTQDFFGNGAVSTKADKAYFNERAAQYTKRRAGRRVAVFFHPGRINDQFSVLIIHRIGLESIVQNR